MAENQSNRLALRSVPLPYRSIFYISFGETEAEAAHRPTHHMVGARCLATREMCSIPGAPISHASALWSSRYVMVCGVVGPILGTYNIDIYSFLNLILLITVAFPQLTHQTLHKLP